VDILHVVIFCFFGFVSPAFKAWCAFWPERDLYGGVLGCGWGILSCGWGKLMGKDWKGGEQGRLSIELYSSFQFYD